MSYQNQSARSQISVLGALMIGYAVLGLAIGAVAFFILMGVGWASGDGDAFIILSSVATGVALLFAIGSIPSLIAGIGLLKTRPWSRVLTLVASAINLVNFPFGTALAIYAIVLLSSPATSHVLDAPSGPVPPSSSSLGHTEPSAQ